jgi:hypothetical protein
VQVRLADAAFYHKTVLTDCFVLPILDSLLTDAPALAVTEGNADGGDSSRVRNMMLDGGRGRALTRRLGE